jgi:hypothetical protein
MLLFAVAEQDGELLLIKNFMETSKALDHDLALPEGDYPLMLW